MNARQLVIATAALLICIPVPRSFAGDPTELLPGEAPVLFTSSEGANVGTETVLLDGQLAVGDDIWLWVPALDGNGDVDLVATGQFFRIWDSGNAVDNPGDFNDDDANGMRGMDFDPASSTFLISYEDTTTTGFAIGGFPDGALMRMTPTAITGGAVTDFTLSQLYDECANGTAGCIGTADINSLCLALDGTFFYGAGGTQTIVTDVPGMLAVGSSTLVHADGITGPSPVNLGPDKFFEASVSGCGVIFCPAIYNGQLRGADILESGLLTFGTSGDYRNTVFTGPIDGLSDAEAEALAINVEDVCLKADICSVPDIVDMALNTYQRRTGVVLYPGSLFFQAPNVDNAEILDHDIIDTQAELGALILLLGTTSPAGMALAAHQVEDECLGDRAAPQDGAVTTVDLLALLAQWGGPGGCDLDGGGVSVTDLLALLAAWGPC